MVHSTASREATERRRLHYIPLPRSYYAKATYTIVRSRCVEGARARAHTHTYRVSCITDTLRASWCGHLPLLSSLLSHTSTMGTMDIYIYIYFREHPVYTRARRKHTRVWYACFSNMRKYTCIRVCLCIGTICDSVFRKKGPHEQNELATGTRAVRYVFSERCGSVVRRDT